jgi:hypothetical protein
MTDIRPGLNPKRLVRLMDAAINRCSLHLADRTVLTEAATGPYVVTPVLAAMAGAEVYALAGSTAYAHADELERVTVGLAESAGVDDRVRVVFEKSPEVVGAAEIVTNSGQIRPIDAALVAQMKDSAVIPLMYESWEYRCADVDLAACRARNIQVAGTNERHPAIDVFSFLGLMAVKQLHDAGVAVYGSSIVLLCDNAFAPFIAEGLRRGGAEIIQADALTESVLSPQRDAVIVAMRPREPYVFTNGDAGLLADASPGTVVVEYWGDTDRAALSALRIPVWPPNPAEPGHMAILPSAVGPEPIVRLQAGGLKAGEVLARGLDRASQDELAFVQPL